jgi:starch synthase (maltosyl-transferring)
VSLSKIIERLAEQARPISTPYFVPGLWIDARSSAAQPVNPYQFYHRRLSEIAAAEPLPLIGGAPGGEWSRNAIIYNLFPRLTAAFDHAGDGRLDIEPDAEGWRETGTLLKCIALLPYLKSMNFNTIHLLPITAVGQDGKKAISARRTPFATPTGWMSGWPNRRSICRLKICLPDSWKRRTGLASAW